MNVKTVLWRGLCKRCPQCGKGKLFTGYIKQNDECSECHEPLADLRADDAPPWLTILVTGHLLAPLILFFVHHSILPEAVEITILVALAILCVFLILPRAKGLFIAILWLTRLRKSKA